jgi:hypothetical protein
LDGAVRFLRPRRKPPFRDRADAKETAPRRAAAQDIEAASRGAGRRARRGYGGQRRRDEGGALALANFFVNFFGCHPRPDD